MSISKCGSHFAKSMKQFLGILTGKASVSFLQAFLRCHMCLAKSAQTEKKSASYIRLVLIAKCVDCTIRIGNNLQYLVILRQKKRHTWNYPNCSNLGFKRHTFPNDSIVKANLQPLIWWNPPEIDASRATAATRSEWDTASPRLDQQTLAVFQRVFFNGFNATTGFLKWEILWDTQHCHFSSENVANV